MLVRGEQLLHLRHQFRPVVAEAVHAHALPRTFVHRLGEEGKGQLAVAGVIPASRQHEGRGGHAVLRHHLLGAALVERERQGEGVGRVVRHPQEFADRGDVALATGTVESLGDVEDEVGSLGGEPGGEVRGGFEQDDLAHRAERRCHGCDGGGFVPLGVEVGLREVRAELAIGGGSGGERLGLPSGRVSRSDGLLVVCESYPNSQRRPSTKKAVLEKAGRARGVVRRRS